MRNEEEDDAARGGKAMGMKVITMHRKKKTLVSKNCSVLEESLECGGKVCTRQEAGNKKKTQL